MPIPTQQSMGLGCRPKGYTSDATDYQADKVAKRDLLNSMIGCTALMKGLIVWCLAYDVVKMKAVTGGPTSLSQNQGILLGVMHGLHLVDDFLEVANKDVICRVYHVDSGRLFGMPWNNTT